MQAGIYRETIVITDRSDLVIRGVWGSTATVVQGVGDVAVLGVTGGGPVRVIGVSVTGASGQAGWGNGTEYGGNTSDPSDDHWVFEREWIVRGIDARGTTLTLEDVAVRDLAPGYLPQTATAPDLVQNFEQVSAINVEDTTLVVRGLYVDASYRTLSGFGGGSSTMALSDTILDATWLEVRGMMGSGGVDAYASTAVLDASRLVDAPWAATLGSTSLTNVTVAGAGLTVSDGDLAIDSCIVTGAATGLSLSTVSAAIVHTAWYGNGTNVSGAPDPVGADGYIPDDCDLGSWTDDDDWTDDHPSVPAGSPCADAGNPDPTRDDPDGTREPAA